eukprot:TRINITY_DN8673_c0_g1_i1.p2 TRINITY_DN8673_c0_g1~~TRINITY_DN8673_c0_g1_i1.p2  ORF type:complete len:350 (+),score=107.55 TRINITY_DN8673_c0_g1_i1:59-1108(+)
MPPATGGYASEAPPADSGGGGPYRQRSSSADSPKSFEEGSPLSPDPHAEDKEEDEDDSAPQNEDEKGEKGAKPSGVFELSFHELKSKDDFRMQYLRKISHQNVWVPREKRPPQHQTVVIFDWDDTLLPTSFLNLRSDQQLTQLVSRHLRGIEAAGRKLLEMAKRLGQTFIITNAMTGWVEYSAEKWLPGLAPLLKEFPIISARTKFEHVFPGEVQKWKVQAFLEVQRQLDSQIITNLISLGDSNFEIDAVHVMGKEFAQALVKTIKFRESPSPEELLKQLELVAQKFERIVENARNLKIGLERKWVAGGGGGAGQAQQPPPADDANASQTGAAAEALAAKMAAADKDQQ